MLQFLCGLSKLCLIILLFPLRESQDDRKVLANFCSYRFDDRYRKSSALDQRTTIRVLTNIGAFPKEIINQIPVRSVQLERIESQLFGVGCGLGECLNNLIYFSG